MKTYPKLLALLLSLLLIVCACKKDEDPIDTGGPDNSSQPGDIIAEENEKFAAVMTTELVTANVFGIVVDENGNPMQGVALGAGGQNAVSDAEGRFLMGDLSLNSRYATLTAKQAGYLDAFKTFRPNPDGVNNLRVTLLKEPVPQNFNAMVGAVLTIDAQIQLSFPANSISYPDGEPYSGIVQVYGRYIDPTADDLAAVMPGMLVGLEESSASLGALYSYGMMGVELRDASGNEVQIAAGQEVSVELPAAADAPSTAPFWHFNETYGLWIESGTATKSGDKYLAYANHFSYWNIDILTGGGGGIEENEITLTFLDLETSFALSNHHMAIFHDNQPIGEFQTNASGDARLVGLPSVVTIIYEICDNLFANTISTEPDFETISVDMSSAGARTKVIDGTLNTCTEAGETVPVADVFGIVTSTGLDTPEIYLPFVVEDGFFLSSFIICDPDFNGQIPIELQLWESSGVTTKSAVLSVDETVVFELEFDLCDSEETEIDDSFVIPFVDENFIAALRAFLGIPSGDITYGDVKDITSLSLTFKEIYDIQGIEYFTSLQVLDLTTNFITDITSIGALTELRELTLDNNVIVDISALDLLLNLESLVMPLNAVVDIEVIGSLVNLRHLNIHYNQIEDISPLSGLSNLIWLDASGNLITDISPLTGMTSLQECYLDYNPIEVIPDLDGLDNMIYLSLLDNELTDISGLADLSNVEVLILKGNQLSNLSPLANLGSIDILNLNQNQISNTSALSGLLSLTELKLRTNNISDPSPLAGLVDLELLDLGHNAIVDPSSLCGLGTSFNGTIDLVNNSIVPANISNLNACLPAANIIH